MELFTALGFDGMLLAHALGSSALFIPVYRWFQGLTHVHPKVEKLLAALIVAVLNVLIEIARGDAGRVDFPMLSSVVVGAFLALVLNDALTKKKEPTP